MYSSSAASSTNFDQNTTQHNTHLQNSIKDLRNLGTQLYSAATYFEVSYTQEDQKRIVKNTLKDYIINAVVNTVNHLTSITQSTDNFINDYVKIDGPAMDFRVSCVEQRLKTYQEYVDHAGLSQQSYLVRNTKYHKRYILPVGAQSESKAVPRVSEFYLHDKGSEARVFQDEFRKIMRENRQSRKVLSLSPSQSSYSSLSSSSSSSKQSIPTASPRAPQPVFPSMNGTRRSDSPIPDSNQTFLQRSVTVVNRTPGSKLNSVSNEQKVPDESHKLSSKFKLHSKSFHKLKTLKKSKSGKSKKKSTNVSHSPSLLSLQSAEEGSDLDIEPHHRTTKAFLKSWINRRKSQKKKEEMMMDASKTSKEIELF
ncbi:hypothetical protein ZOSMA_29G00150 [Zostera marina]|uniref:Protein ABIL2 n=1 Tax=Zostera marina TaxID=29655 RepID=A0A0K9PDP3_ZOSMR|nr:hypothetical protein ZOSMA_29G00150 [Zostera marina]